MSHAEQIVPISPAGLPANETIDFEPTNLLSLVLKAPREFAHRVAHDRFEWRASLTLLAAALAFDALYGLAMGAFAGGDTLWMTALKVPLIAVASISLCAPSLYVLLGLSGSPVGLRQAVAVLSGAACLTSMLLVGFAPVAWLFGVSTTNVQFMIVLHIAVCGIGVGYGLRLLGTSVPSGFGGNKVLIVWTTMFLMVCAQMLTHFRPLLTAAADGTFREDRKQFFFEHLIESMTGRPSAVVVERDAPAMAKADVANESPDNVLALAAYLLNGAEEPAEFPGLKDKKVAVVCHPAESLQFGSSSVATEIAAEVGWVLKKHLHKKIKIIPARDVDNWIDENSRGDDDFADIGSALKADMVLGIDLQAFELTQGQVFWQGQSQVRLKVLDMSIEDERDRVVYAKNMPHVVYPPKAGIPMQERSGDEFRRDYVKILADKIGRYFYPQDPNEVAAPAAGEAEDAAVDRAELDPASAAAEPAGESQPIKS